MFVLEIQMFKTNCVRGGVQVKAKFITFSHDFFNDLSTQTTHCLTTTVND